MRTWIIDSTLYLPFRIVNTCLVGYTVAQLVEPLRYKSEGHGFDFRWCHFSLT